MRRCYGWRCGSGPVPPRRPAERFRARRPGGFSGGQRIPVNCSGFFRGASGGPHAVDSVAGGGSYLYDANGNMTSRTEEGETYTQEWTVENKLRKVRWANDTYQTRFVYDGDGNRLLRIEKTPSDETTTVYIGRMYEEKFTGTDLIALASIGDGNTAIALSTVSLDVVVGRRRAADAEPHRPPTLPRGAPRPARPVGLDRVDHPVGGGIVVEVGERLVDDDGREVLHPVGGEAPGE